jgi:ribosomal protein S18 acetylase RimI-like enzyme
MMSFQNVEPIATWRPATHEDDETMVALCAALNHEDPGEVFSEAKVRNTLNAFREHPIRGRAVVASTPTEIVGYAFLVSFWSNECGGEICNIDELYVKPAFRGRGISTRLFATLFDDRELWTRKPVALELEVTPDNTRARAMYERIGFRARNHLLHWKGTTP